MSKSNFAFKAVLATLTLAVSMSVNAGGAVAGATEFTQIMNNAQLVGVNMSTAQSAMTQLDQYMLQIKQWEMQVRNIQGMAQVPDSVQSAIAGYQKIAQTRQAVERLYGNLEKQSSAMNSRFDEARLLNMPWSEYSKRVATDAANGNQAARDRLAYESSVMDQVAESYETARKMGEQVPTTQGVHQALQLMNNQMNRLLVQNTKMTELLAQTMANGGRGAAQMSEEQRKKAAWQKIADDYEAERKNIDDRQRNFMGLK